MNLVFNRLGTSLRDLAKQGEARISFAEGHPDWFVTFADQGVHFPVAQTFSVVDNGWTLFDTATIRQCAPSIILAIALAAFLLAAQMPIQVTTTLFVFEDVLIDPFMTAANPLLLYQPARDLFRTPVLPQQCFHYRPRFGGDSGHRFRPPFHRQILRLLRTITALTSVASQFAANSGFVYINHFCNLCTRMTCFLKRINLVSLLLGKLVIGSHRAPLTWSSEKHYPTPAYLSTTFKVALVS